MRTHLTTLKRAIFMLVPLLTLASTIINKLQAQDEQWKVSSLAIGFEKKTFTETEIRDIYNNHNGVVDLRLYYAFNEGFFDSNGLTTGIQFLPHQMSIKLASETDLLSTIIPPYNKTPADGCKNDPRYRGQWQMTDDYPETSVVAREMGPNSCWTNNGESPSTGMAISFLLNLSQTIRRTWGCFSGDTIFYVMVRFVIHDIDQLIANGGFGVVPYKGGHIEGICGKTGSDGQYTVQFLNPNGGRGLCNSGTAPDWTNT
jgi:hypothetical protein